MGRATFGRLGRAQTDFPEVDALNVHNVIHKGTAAMRPLTVVTTATCFTYLHTSVGYRLTHWLVQKAASRQEDRSQDEQAKRAFQEFYSSQAHPKT